MIRSILATLVLIGVAAPAMGEAPVRLAQAAALSAPEAVDPGSTVAISLSGVAPGGQVELWGPITQDGIGGRLDSVTAADAFATLAAPVRPGSYELRYVAPSGAVQARRVLDVAAVPVILSVPEQLGAGATGMVRWRGPAGPGDRLQIVDATGAVAAEAPAEGAPGADNVAMMRAPVEIGSYRLRYVTGARGAVLRELPIRVGPARTWMRAPVHVGTGQSFEVRWYGFPEPGQAFQIVEADSGNTVVIAQGERANNGVTARLTAPRRTGRYRLRYVDIDTGRAHSDLPLHVGD